jgi:beta-lactamase class A
MRAILDRLKSFPGDVGFYYKNLITGEEARFREDAPFVAASMIKLPIMAEALRRFETDLDENERIELRDGDKLPSCGALAYMRAGLSPTLHDLVCLMIALSDNTATNLLIDRLGMAAVNQTIHDMGLVNTRLNRKLFDAEAARMGVQNYVSARDMGRLFEKIYLGELISKSASARMLAMLKDQQLNGKIPFFLSDLTIAHKTGEDDGLSHDGGIVFAKEPFIACFLSFGVDVPAFERMVQDLSRALARRGAVI